MAFLRIGKRFFNLTEDRGSPRTSESRPLATRIKWLTRRYPDASRGFYADLLH